MTAIRRTTVKKIGDKVTVSVDAHGVPFWTRIEDESGLICCLGHEEAHDLLYAMQRIVAFLESEGY